MGMIFRVDFCLAFIDSINSQTSTSHQVQENIDENDESDKEKIEIIIGDVGSSVLVETKECNDGTLSQPTNDPLHNWVLEFALPNIDETVEEKWNDDEVTIIIVIVVETDSEKCADAQSSKIIEELNPFSPDIVILFLNTLVADQLEEGQQS